MSNMDFVVKNGLVVSTDATVNGSVTANSLISGVDHSTLLLPNTSGTLSTTSDLANTQVTLTAIAKTKAIAMAIALG